MVTLIPESFLGSSFKRAAGTSDANGIVRFRTAGMDVDGVPCGLYRAEISKQDEAGKEILLPRYNAQSTLGCEVAPDLRGDTKFDLRSR
jgi:hypothetical protein